MSKDNAIVERIFLLIAMSVALICFFLEYINMGDILIIFMIYLGFCLLISKISEKEV